MSKGKVIITMPEETPLIGLVLSLLALLGGGVAKLLDYHRQIRELRIQSRKTEIEKDRLTSERFQMDASAASSLADVLSKVVNPLAERIAVLESGAIERQKELIELHDNIIELKKLVGEKDIELAKLRADYSTQLLLTERQEKQIEAQNTRIEGQRIRIEELETKLNILGERNLNGNCE